MKIIPLGTAGFIPTQGKETLSILLIEKRTAILFDAGTGIRRFAEKYIRRQLQDVNELHILISHFHHDHTCGLTWLLRLWESNIKVYVPSQPMVEFDGLNTIDVLTSLPLFALPLKNWQNCKEIVAIKDKEFFVNNVLIKSLPQIHAGGSIGFRVGDFGYITDTEPRDKHVDFLNGCKLVFMDTMHDSSDFQALNVTESTPAQHGYSIGNARVAAKAGIKKLGLIHIDPLYDFKRIRKLLQEAKNEFPGSFIPEEGLVYYVNK